MSDPGRLVMLLVLAVAVSSVAPVGADAQQARGFPHAAHEGLFPLCTGCHEGIPPGDSARAFPDPALCARCHDGVDQEPVRWSGPTRPVNNLRFSHPEHARDAGAEGESPTCATCHRPPGAARPGAVARHPVANCLSCHEHRARDHYVDARCRTCHVPLAETRFSLARIESLPRPSSHESESFVAEAHGEMAEEDLRSCATCHTRERCTSCHVSTATPQLGRMPEAPASMTLPTFTASYPVPGSHRGPTFLEAHGMLAGAGSATCSTCHVREDCTSCHRTGAPAVVQELVSRDAAAAPGVGVALHEPPSHASRFFVEDHEALAASDDASCTTCHTADFCSSCHDGPRSSGFHPANFAAEHPAEAYANRLECSTCHNTQAFCRQCHLESGMRSLGRLGPGFHDGEPVWLLRHPQAARQNLESCQSCHSQRDCLQCHSTLGAFKVSPHGRDFDAGRAFDRNPQICFACHTRNPLEGGGP